MRFILELNDIGLITNILKLLIICMMSYYTSLKIIDKQDKMQNINIGLFCTLVLISIVCAITKYSLGFLSHIVLLTIFLTLILSKNINSSITYSLIIMIVSLSINYIIFITATAISFIPIVLLHIENIYISFLIISIFYIIIVKNFMKIKRFKKGFAFLQRNINYEYQDILILNVSIILLFSVIAISNYIKGFTFKILGTFIIFAIIMFITIQKSLQLYYKQKLFEKELNETKAKLEEKEKEVKELEAENLKISKNSHTLSHKQKSLEYKIEQMMTKAEISTEEAAEVRERVKEIEKDLYKEKSTIKLDKTGIAQIDDMLEYMQSECKKNKIDFELQIKGNIYYMTNNLITKEDLETLLADHIKNAIIAINHTDNVNRSILVRLGEIDGTYSLYIYDSGIEFEKETLENLGKKPSTTHKDEGGTGMGFMNTFDTLRKYEATLIINELNKPSKENYTKAIIIKFDKKNEFQIISYR